MSITFPPLPGDWECGRFFDPEELRARDLEVARAVRDRIADVMDAGGYRSQITAISIRQLEFTHHD